MFYVCCCKKPFESDVKEVKYTKNTQIIVGESAKTSMQLGMMEA